MWLWPWEDINLNLCGPAPQDWSLRQRAAPHCLHDPGSSSAHLATSTQPSRGSCRGSPGLLTRYPANLIKSQIHNTLFKIQMFFTETSRRKGAERNGPMKVIRMRLQGRVPTARSSLSALGAVGEHLETTSLASYTFITPQTETP